MRFGLTVCAGLLFAGVNSNVRQVLSGEFQWAASTPLIAAENRDGDQYHAIKDPSIVRHDGRWHVFCTLRGKNRSHQIEYLSFKSWNDVAKARRVTLKLTSGYFCAPQVFYFRPHKKWYLIHQITDKSRTPVLQPAFSTTSDLSDPDSWTSPKLLFQGKSKGVKNWIDFWVICDARQAHLFFTTLNGRMHRADTALAAFPDGWEQPKAVIEGDVFEASHTYRLKNTGQYLTFIEAQAPGGRRYFKAYLAGSLTGAWRPAADSLEKSFAAPGNVTFAGEPWTESFSHGELIRDSNDETLTVDPAKLMLLFQGVGDRDRQGKNYAEIPWKLGLLTVRQPSR
ncbi:MAG: non-reducing end alpha-L-arabinofuranosidase family hydrolase [Acidobacteria bacterium]|nr:non-reducing end alpha-L-arabinofuranosidase family hydrolase [Acidobacteriota bacterium]